MADNSLQSPYVGLQPFREDHEAFFFGRERDIRVIASNLLAPSLTVLYGPSGVGKSSILRAGVMPYLRNQPKAAAVYFNRWQDISFPEELKREIRKVVRRPSEQTLPDRELSADIIASQATDALHIILDQFEEYLLYHEGTQLAEDFDSIVARLVNADSSAIKVLIGIREDGLSKFDRRFAIRIPDLLGNTLPVAPLTAKAAREAIREPLRVWTETRARKGETYEIEDRLVDSIVSGVQSGKATITETSGRGAVSKSGEDSVEAAFLQLVLTKLWEAEQKEGSRVLREQTLEKLGGAIKILQSHVDGVMSQLENTHQRDIAARIFQFLVTPSGTKIAQSPSDLVQWAEAGEKDVRAVLRKLTDPWETRILRQIGTPERYELYHDVLAAAVLDWRRRYSADKSREEEQRKRAEEDARKQRELDQAKALAKEQQEKLDLQKRLDDALKDKNRDIVSFSSFVPDSDEGANLQKIRDTLEDTARFSSSYYLRLRTKVSRSSVILKTLGAAFATLAFIQPALGMLGRTTTASSILIALGNSIFFYLLCGGAAACFGAHHFGKYAEKIERYTRIADDLSRGLADFQMEWIMESDRGWLLHRAREFRSYIEDVVRRDNPQSAAREATAQAAAAPPAASGSGPSSA